MSDTVGQLLRAARESRGQTLDDIESVTRIRARHLAALEADDYAALPSLAQARGFVKNYAEYLELDIQDILGRYEQALKKRPVRAGDRPGSGSRPGVPAGASTRPPRPPIRAPAPPEHLKLPARTANGQAARAAPPRPRRGPPAVDERGQPRVRPRRFLSADLLVATVITLLLAALLAWGGLQLAPTLIATPTLAAGGLAGATAGSAGPATATTTPLAAPTATVATAGSASPGTPAAAYTGVNVTVRAEQRAWVGVSVDGLEVFAGLMPPGEAREFIGQSVVEVITGNAKGTRVIWNGVDQGLLGDLGEVVVRLWTVEGMLLPTPSPTPAVTPTPGG
jgi:hypothetical protein